jgi:cysteine desulfurase/selenocysteine lyase
MDAIQTYKKAFERTNGLIHLNNAGVAPWPLQTERIVNEWASKMASEGTFAAGAHHAKTEETRGLLGQVLGAAPTQIAFFQTCASAISQVALGFDFKAGDEIIVWDQEYPSNFFPWKVAADRSGAKLVIASSDASLATPFENIQKVVTDRTRVIAVSWAQYRSGAITDLTALSDFARKRGIFTCVDIIQAAGAVPFDFNASGLDAACGGAHKWMTSPLALGFLILKPEHVESLHPLSVGAVSYGGPETLSNTQAPMMKGVQRFEPGGRSVLEMIGLGESLRLIAATGVARIAQENEWLSKKLMHGLRERGHVVNSPHGSHFHGAIVNFSPGADSSAKTIEAIDKRLTEARVSFSKRPPGVRLAPHAFVTAEQIDRVLEVLT